MDTGKSNQQIRAERLVAAKKLGDYTKNEWEEMKDYFKKCVKCEGRSGLINIEKDHIVPLYMGGSNSIKNIQPLCAKCNASKSDCIDYRKIYARKYNIKLDLKWL